MVMTEEENADVRVRSRWDAVSDREWVRKGVSTRVPESMVKHCPGLETVEEARSVERGVSEV